MLIKVERECRVCRQIPKDGYYPSRIARGDYICPKDSKAKTQRYQRDKRALKNAKSNGDN